MIRFLFTGILAVTLALLPKNVQDEINILDGSSVTELKKTMDSLTPQERAAIVAFLKGPNELYSGDNTKMLIELGDDETIAREVQSFPQESDGGGSNLGYMIQPKVITYLAPYLYINEPYVLHRISDITIEPKSFDADSAIKHILASSPYFSKEVNKWARSWQFGDPATGREAVRNWWNANKKYFDVANYLAVQPGAPPPAGTMPPLPSHDSTPEPTAAPAPAWTLPSSIPRPATPALTPFPVAPPASSLWPDLAIFVLVAAGLAGAGLWFVRRGPKP